MKAIMVMFDSLNRHFLEPYGCDFTKTPNFQRLAAHTLQFEKCYAGSLPCMPARRELHTGRYNFLHRSWGPIEPFDDSMPQILRQNGIHTHLVSDHGHYWEDGGATYHNRYSTWENFRGQEGDHWKGVVGGIKDPQPSLVELKGMRASMYMQDQINRSYMKEEKDHPQIKTFDAGIEFINVNHDKDQWFLQIEAFDPHEPFFSYQEYKDLYPHDYDGPLFDWPDYSAVRETPEQVQHMRYEYFALLSMCDRQLGRVLDLMDQYHLWDDTMLIVNTDHGYLLSEHGFWAKNYMPLYEEIVHTPLFIWDPRYQLKGEKRNSLVQTIDLPVTLLDFFGLEIPKDMNGISLRSVIEKDSISREAVLFGLHGGHICCTDGRYVYMKASVREDNRPLYDYTLMPTHMVGFFSPEEIKSMEYHEPFRFTKELPVMRFEVKGGGSHYFGDLLFDLATDPKQENPIQDEGVEARMKKLMIALMEANEAPQEEYVRVGLK